MSLQKYLEIKELEDNMDYYKHEEIAAVQFYTLRLAEDELMLYESCINYVLENSSLSELYDYTGCDSKNNLQAFQRDLFIVLKQKSDPRLLPERINDCDAPILEMDDGPVCISAL